MRCPGSPADILGVLRACCQERGGHRLLLTTAVRATAVFAADRGRQQLAAWQGRAHGVPAPIMVLDPAAARQAWWPPHWERREWRGSTARLADAGHTPTMQFSGIPFGYAGYPDAEVLKAGAAVPVIPRAVDTGPPGRRFMNAQQREVTTRLDNPLGPRVLLDQQAAVVMVHT